MQSLTGLMKDINLPMFEFFSEILSKIVPFFWQYVLRVLTFSTKSCASSIPNWGRSVLGKGCIVFTGGTGLMFRFLNPGQALTIVKLYSMF